MSAAKSRVAPVSVLGPLARYAPGFTDCLTGLDPVSWTRGYAAFCVAAVWFEYCSSKVTGVIWPIEA